MANVPLAGSAVSLNYGWETVAFGTEAGTIDKYFGHGQKITIKRNNSADRLYGLGSREATASVAKNWAGSFTIDFIHSSEVTEGGSSFWKWVMGKVTDTGTTPKIHTFEYNTDKTLTSATLAIGFNQPTTDYEWNLLGAIVSTATVNFRVNEPIKVTLDGLYANETLGNSLQSYTAIGATNLPYEYAEATVTFSSTLTRCQEFILVINNTPEMLWGLGSRIPSAVVGKNVECNFRFVITYEASTWDALLYGQATGPLTTTTPAETASLTISVTNGGATTAERQLIFTLANAFVNVGDIAFDPNEVVKVTYEGWCRTITSIVQEDNTTTTP